MAQVAATIDAVRVGATPDVWVLILKHTVKEQYPSIQCYLPIWISQPQAHIITGELVHVPEQSTAPDAFLANINATESKIECVTIHLFIQYRAVGLVVRSIGSNLTPAANRIERRIVNSFVF